MIVDVMIEMIAGEIDLIADVIMRDVDGTIPVIALHPNQRHDTLVAQNPKSAVRFHLR